MRLAAGGGCWLMPEGQTTTLLIFALLHIFVKSIKQPFKYF